MTVEIMDLTEEVIDANVNVIDKYHIPRLVDDYSIVQYDDKAFTLCIEAERPLKLNIDFYTKRLLDQIDGTRNLEQVTEEFNSNNAIKLTVDDTIEIFNKRIAGFGILAGDNNERIKIKDNYLKLRFKIFPTNLVNTLASKLTFLYSEKYFKYAFLGVLTFMLLNLFIFMDFGNLYADLNPSFVTFIMVANILGVVVHEFGHAIACVTFGARNGPIGFGFYMVFPVMYSDVSDAWRLNRKQRIIVDLGGIYIQLLYCSLFVLTFYFTQDLKYVYLSSVIMMVSLINLNPWLRYDGYWALSDIWQISNLKDKAQFTVKNFFRWCIGSDNAWKNTGRQRFLLIYGLSRTTVLIVFLVYALIYRRDSILNFPGNVVDAFTVLFNDFGSIDFHWIKSKIRLFLIPTIFCIIFTRELIKYLKIRVKK